MGVAEVEGGFGRLNGLHGSQGRMGDGALRSERLLANDVRI